LKPYGRDLRRQWQQRKEVQRQVAVIQPPIDHPKQRFTMSMKLAVEWMVRHQQEIGKATATHRGTTVAQDRPDTLNTQHLGSMGWGQCIHGAGGDSRGQLSNGS
jgi:hypothetical protein